MGLLSVLRDPIVGVVGFVLLIIGGQRYLLSRRGDGQVRAIDKFRWTGGHSLRHMLHGGGRALDFV